MLLAPSARAEPNAKTPASKTPTSQTTTTSANLAAAPASTTTADEAKTTASATDTAEEHLRGLEIALRPSIGSAGASSPLQARGDSADTPQPLRPGAGLYGPSIGGGLQLGFRFHPLVSAGLRADIGTVSASAPTDGTKDLSRSWQSGGLYARVYPLALNEGMRRYVDPWVATGVTYVHDVQSFSTSTPSATGNVDVAWQADSHAIGVPIGVGVDYRLTKWLSAGPSFEYTIMNPIAGCVKGMNPATGAEARACTDDSSAKKGLVAVATGAWNASLMLRVTPF